MEHERFLPGFEGEIWYEHWHRYHFIAALAAGREVLDIACGEGYGTALLARGAKKATGVDVAPDVVAHARRRYGAAANIDFRDGRCEAIPLADASVDLVVSFETLEHIPDPGKLVLEVARVLRPGGIFAVSTPNKEIYSDRRGYRNPHHLKELYRDEFVAMARASFPEVALFGQRVDAYSAIWPVSGEAARGQLLDARMNEAADPLPGVADAMYFLAICGRDAQAVAQAAGRFSLLSDRDHGVMEDYQSLRQRLAQLEAHVERIEAAYQASQQQVAALTQERERLAAHLAPAQPATNATGWRRR
jgi:SAM-dependent methyltransferase